MQNARTIDRPIPLVCTECGALIGVDEECEWRERTPDEAAAALGLAPSAIAFMVPGAIGKHTKCPGVL